MLCWRPEIVPEHGEIFYSRIVKEYLAGRVVYGISTDVNAEGIPARNGDTLTMVRRYTLQKI